ncbi:hypothetical protein VKT23_008814 [Stygiomarasmius scandens]|uniref:Uncharacterized protein n=1 Tax=Marasmiellus scandens TaxID=2682957 RepID=A0ABR1JKY0_9AGAR
MCPGNNAKDMIPKHGVKVWNARSFKITCTRSRLNEFSPRGAVAAKRKHAKCCRRDTGYGRTFLGLWAIRTTGRYTGMYIHRTSPAMWGQNDL